MRLITEALKGTLALRALSFFKIPLLFWCSPTVIEISDKRCVVKLPLMKRTKNHLGSMYFGALCVGADCAGGIIAWQLIQKSRKKVALIFKDFQAEFLKRVEGDCYFTCEQGEEIQALVTKAIETGDRVEMPVKITATVPRLLGDEPVAQFLLTLSLKHK